MATFGSDAVTFNTTAGNKTVAITPSKGALLVAICANTGTTTDPTVTDDRGGSYTRIAAASCVKAASADEMHFYVRDDPVNENVSHTLTMNVGGAGTGGGIIVIAISGMTRSGTGAVRQAAKQDNVAAATPAPAFGVAALTGNLTIGAVFNATNPATMTTPGSWTERRDVGYATPATGLESVTRDSGFTGTTVTWGSASASAFCSMIIELDASAAPPGPPPRRRRPAHRFLTVR
jgi:hypothetical protein